MIQTWRLLLISGIGALLLTACGAYNDSTTPWPDRGDSIPATAGSHQVGYRIVDTTSDSRKLSIAVWYPTAAPAQAYAYGSGKVKGRAAEGAPIKSGRWPLVIFSHGYSGGGIGSVAITEALAARGYVVAAPDHNDEVMSVRIRGGETGNVLKALRNLKDKPPSLSEHGYRLTEVKDTLGIMLQAPEFSVDDERVAMMGHSMGGWTIVNVALQEPRVKALVLYSMGELSWLFKGQKFFEAETFRRLRVPSIYFYGAEEDKANPRGAYAKFCFDHSPSPSYLVEIPDANHFVYNGRAVAPRSGGTTAQTRQIVDATGAFLDRYLLGKSTDIIASDKK